MLLSKLLCPRGPNLLLMVKSAPLTTSALSAARNSFQQRMGAAARPRVGVGIGRAGPTLRERLLGPTTGKPFIYGTWALAGGSAAGIGMLCYYGLGMSGEMGARERAALWPQYVRDRIRLTYTYLGGSLAATAGAAYLVAQSPKMLELMSRGSLMVMLGGLAAVMGTGAICRSIPYEQGALKHAAWLVHCATLGALVAPLCLLGGPVLMRAAWYTAGIVAGLSATAACAPSEQFLKWSGPLAMGLGVVIVANIGTFFLPPGSALGASLMSVVMYGGLLLFCAFLMYDTQKVVHSAEHHPMANRYAPDFPAYDPINAQMGIYLDVLNIFMRIAMILGMGGNRKK